MACDRRISATFKDAPGGQVLGPTFDYTHRLLDFALAAEGLEPPEAVMAEPLPPEVPHVTEFLDREGLIQVEEVPEDDTPRDLTREPLELPAGRPLRLQALTRGDEGFVLGMAYSTQRGYGRNHPFVGELRIGTVPVEVDLPELGFAVEVGEALVDRALRWEELGEDNVGAPAQDEEFVLYHSDNIQATGFLEHIKLPHYVDFQSELELIRKLRREAGTSSSAVTGVLAREAAE